MCLCLRCVCACVCVHVCVSIHICVCARQCGKRGRFCGSVETRVYFKHWHTGCECHRRGLGAIAYVRVRRVCGAGGLAGAPPSPPPPPWRVWSWLRSARHWRARVAGRVLRAEWCAGAHGLRAVWRSRDCFCIRPGASLASGCEHGRTPGAADWLRKNVHDDGIGGGSAGAGIRRRVWN